MAGRNYESSFAVALVGINYFLMNLSFSFLWQYAIAKKLVPQNRTKEKLFKRDVAISIIGGVLLIISIPLAYVSTYISFALFIIINLMHLGKQIFR